MAKPIFPESKHEYKSVWIGNTDELIAKRITWMRQRGWLLIAAEVSSSSPGKMHLKFRKEVP